MSATGTIYVENPNTQMLTYTSIRVYRGTTSNPNTAAFTTLVTTITLVANTEQYAFTDASGTVDSLWRFDYYHTVSTASSGLGPIIRPAAQTTLRLIRIEAAKRVKPGYQSTCSSVGTSTTLIDAALTDTGVGTGFLEAAWVYRPDAAAAGDKLRRVKKDGFTVSTGTLSFDRLYTNAPASGEVYHIYGMYPPVDAPGVSYSWTQAVRDGLEHAYFEDEVNLGPGTSTGQRQFSLAAHLGIIDRNHIRRVLLRTTDANSVTWDIDADKNGRWWKPVVNGPGSLAVELNPPPGTSQDVILECVRTDTTLYIDTDTTQAPLELAVRGTLWALYEQANIDQPGKYVAELRGARERFVRAGGSLPNQAVQVG